MNFLLNCKLLMVRNIKKNKFNIDIFFIFWYTFMEKVKWELNNLKEKIDAKDNNIENNKKSKKKNKKARKIFFIIFIIILIAGISIGGWFGFKIYQNGGGEFNAKGLLATIVGHDEKTVKKLPKIFCLVTGQSQNLTDTIMVCSYDPKTQEASILSIPRDTFVGKNKSRADSYDKINALYQSSPEETLKAVNNITGLDIKYYLNIDTEALREVVDSIGGVYFDVPIDMEYDDGTQDVSIRVKAGYQLLDGNKAEQVVRFRHNNDGSSYPIEYGDNDLGRMKTQRAFIEAVIKKLATPSTLTKLPELIKVAEKNVTTNLDFNILKDYAPYAIEFKTENLKTATLPGTPELINQIWFYTPYKSEIEDIVEDLFRSDEEDIDESANDSETITNSTKNEKEIVTKNSTDSGDNKTTGKENETNINGKIKVEILNGTSNNEKLSEVKAKLKELGYNITKTGITSNASKTMIINRTKQSDTIEKNIKEAINNIGITSKGSDNSNVDFTIIIGTDYK